MIKGVLRDRSARSRTSTRTSPASARPGPRGDHARRRRSARSAAASRRSTTSSALSAPPAEARAGSYGLTAREAALELRRVDRLGLGVAPGRTASAWSPPRPHAGAKVRLDALAHASLRRSASKRSRSSPSRARAVPQVRVLEPGLVGEQRVVHLPETALQRRRPRRRRRPAQARGWLERTGKWRKTTGAAGSVAQALLQRRAVRALEVGVDDHQRRAVGPRTWSSSAGPGTGAEPSSLTRRDVPERQTVRGRRRSGWRRAGRRAKRAW